MQIINCINKISCIFKHRVSVSKTQRIRRMKFKLIKPHLLLLILGSVTLLAPKFAFGQETFLSNLGQEQANVNNTDNDPVEGDAVSFTTGNVEVSLDSVTLPLLNNNSNGTNLSVFIYSNSGSIPGSVVAQLTGPAGGIGSTANYVFTAPENIILQANTTYWIVTADAVGDNGGYLWTDTFSHNVDAGSDPTWQLGKDLEYYPTLFPENPWFDPGNEYVQQFSIQGTVMVPEPTMPLALVGLTLGGLALLRRFRPSRLAVC